MKLRTSIVAALVLLVAAASPATAASTLWELAANADGVFGSTLTGDPPPPGLDTSGIDLVTGLGTMTYTQTAPGNHFVIGYFDLDVGIPADVYYNEYGTVFGSPEPGQSWEIDEPSYVFGDIWFNVQDGLLDNTNAIPQGLEDDGAMAIGWDYSLPPAATAVIDFTAGEAEPASGFYLSQTDVDTGETVYLSSTIDITVIPEPLTVLGVLFAAASVGGYVRRRK